MVKKKPSGNKPKPKSSSNKGKQKSQGTKSIANLIQFTRSPEGRKVFALVLILASVFMVIAFLSHFWTGHKDQSNLQGDGTVPSNWLGSVGAWLSEVFVREGFGLLALLIPIYTSMLGFAILEKNFYSFLWKVLKYVVFIVVWGSTTLYFISVLLGGEGLIGGNFGKTMTEGLSGMFGMIGAGLIILVSLLIASVLIFNADFPVSKLLAKFLPIIEEGEEETGQPSQLDATDQGNAATIAEETDESGQSGEEGNIGDFVLAVHSVKDDPSGGNADNDANVIRAKDSSTFTSTEVTQGNPHEPEIVPVSPVAPAATGLELEIEPTLPSAEEITEINTHRNQGRHQDRLELQIEEIPEEEEVLPNAPTAIEGDNIEQTGEDKYEKIIPEASQETLDENDELADWEQYDPKLELSTYQHPNIELLIHRDGSKSREVNRTELEANKNKIVQTLQHYKIDITSIKATIGPTVTLYEIVPAPGVRISKIRNLEDDIALSLAALGIRIIAPIPGKGTIGIEIPNSNPEIVGMRSVLATKKFQETKAELPLALGRTISNEVMIVDLAKMPHMLIAGATGQGKSVGINGIISSILFKKHPSQVKFVLIDPKKVELNLYDDLKMHFLAKMEAYDEAIITDTRQVVHVLNSLCKEMDNRYDLLKKAKARNLREYNDKFLNRRLNPKKGHRFMPYIVLIIDEFADLMMTAGKEIETPVARLAQLARAIGIHLILATQRPSVNVITGIIKANFPARISFRVMSKVDSRTILDGGGADQLIGRGDMLLNTGGDMTRIQNAFIDTPEVEKLVESIAEQRGYPQPYFLPEVPMEGGDDGPTDTDLSERDAMFDEAARLVVKHQQGSTSLIQRRLKLGYNRAGRIIDQLEVAGIVGPFSGSKAREVLVTDEYALEQMLSDLDS